MNRSFFPNNRILPRNQIPREYCWDIESLYSSDQEWKKDYLEIDEMLINLAKFKDNLVRNSHSLLKGLQLKDSIAELLHKIYTYAHMRKDEDNSNNSYQSLFFQASALLVKVEKVFSFIEPEILSTKEEKIKEWLDKNRELEVYTHYLESIFRKKEHILSPEEEMIIARAGNMAQVFEQSFELLSYADLKFPKIKDDKGEITHISHSNFTTLLRNNEKNFRKRVFQNYFKVYRGHSNIYTSLLAGNVKKDQFYSSVRKYQDSLDAALFKDNIPREVYSNLLELTHQNIHLLHKYMRLKADYLHLERLNYYDLYAPVIEDDLTVEYQEACNIVSESLQPLGKMYLSILEKAFQERWIDIYENEGKTSGAYSSGTYRSKPFILMNYQGTLEDVYTLAHELGHSVNSYLINHNQPFIYSDISIFLAEIASTTNEVLLTNYLLKKAANKKRKITILHHFLEQFRTTFFRQAMFAEFELFIHQAQESGESLTADFLKQKYTDLNRLYYGENVIIDKEIGMEWARIPHFFYNYYVFQYATGFAIAIALSQKILQKGSSMAEKYLDFLKQGDSDYPTPVLKKIEIDPIAPNYLQESFKVLADLLDQFQNI